METVFNIGVFGEFSDKNYLSLKGLKPTVSCVRDEDATGSKDARIPGVENITVA